MRYYVHYLHFLDYCPHLCHHVYLNILAGKQNKWSSPTFQPPEEGWSVQRPKCCDKHGVKDEDNSLKNVNNVNNRKMS